MAVPFAVVHIFKFIEKFRFLSSTSIAVEYFLQIDLHLWLVNRSKNNLALTTPPLCSGYLVKTAST